MTKAEREAFELIPDDERQCEICKTTCFLSAVTCNCVKSLVCLRHYSELCKCVPEKHTLKYRYTLDELPLMLRKLKVKAESFETWITKVRDVLDPATPRVMTLEDLQLLAQEAEDKKFPSSVLLERLNSAVLEAEKCVTVIQQLDINKVRTRTRNSTCEIAKYKLTIDELDMFVQEIDNLCCIIQEGDSVRELQQMGKEFTEMANDILSQPLNQIKESAVEKLIEEGSSLCIELSQMKPLKTVLEKLRWYTCVREIIEADEKIPIQIIKKYIKEGHDLEIVDEFDDNLVQKELLNLESIMVDVEEWEAEARKCFESGTQHEIPEIEELLLRADSINGKLQSQGMLEDALKKAKEWLATVEILQTNEHYPYLHTLENVVNRGKNIPFQLEELKRMEEHLTSARSWKQRTSRTFLKRNSNLELMEVLSPRDCRSANGNKNENKHNMDSYREDQISKQFPEDMGPTQMVITFKGAEEKEMADMRELRQKNIGKNPENDTYCVCGQAFYGTMYCCNLCKDWFHTGCIRNAPTAQTTAPINNTTPLANKSIRSPANSPSGLPLSPSNVTMPQSSGRSRDREFKYMCEMCQRSKRPRLEIILTLLVSLQKLPIRLPEGEALQCLTERAMNWQDRARQILATDEVALALECMQKQSVLDGKPEFGGNTLTYKNVEHAYSSSTSLPGVKQLDENATNITMPDAPKPGSPTPTSIQLHEDTQQRIEELLMEGDLLEVSLDETQFLWRLYNATKPDITDLALINLTYKIKVSIKLTILWSYLKKVLLKIIVLCLF